MTHAQKPYFVFRRNGRVHLNWRGRQFSRLLAAEVCASAVVMLDTPRSEVVWRVLATHSIRQFPFTSPPVRHLVPSHFNWTLRITDVYCCHRMFSISLLIALTDFGLSFCLQWRKWKYIRESTNKTIFIMKWYFNQHDIIISLRVWFIRPSLGSLGLSRISRNSAPSWPACIEESVAVTVVASPRISRKSAVCFFPVDVPLFYKNKNKHESRPVGCSVAIYINHSSNLNTGVLISP
jgi:hypothetical protein